MSVRVCGLTMKTLYYVHACTMYLYTVQEMQSIPVSTDVWVVGDLIIIDPSLALLHEPVLLMVGPDAGCSQERLLEVRVDWGTGDRL